MKKIKKIDYYGIDTETYTQNGEGLLSIQIHGKDTSEYIGLNNDIIDFSDEEIRYILLDDFMYFLDDLKNDSVFYFFNLKFDFSQMEKYLLEHYTLSDEYTLSKGEMSILQSPLNVYSVRFRSIGSGRMVYFNDLYHLVNTSLDNACYEFIGEVKIELSNKAFVKEIPSNIEIEYAKRDAELTYKLAMALKDIEGFDLTTSITIGSRTLNLFKDIIRSFHSTYTIVGHPVKLTGQPKKDVWTYFGYEEEELQNFEQHIRLGVRGGITQAFQTGIFDNCIHLDISSAHPSQMVKNIPYGPMLDEIPGPAYTYMAFPSGAFKLKRNGLKIMTFRSKALCHRFHNPETGEELEPSSFASSFTLDGSFGIWKEEYEQLLSQYHFTSDGETNFKYFSTRKDERLTAMVEGLYYGKEHTHGAKRTVFKYLLNSLYGKFLTRPDGETINYTLDKSTGYIKRVTVEDNGRKPVNLALGSWISTQTRVQLINGCLTVPRDCLLYSDTDSIIFKQYNGWDQSFTLGDNLGDWGLESTPSKVNIVGPKTYQELINGNVITRCAGLSRRVASTIPFGGLVEGLTVTRLKAERNPSTLAIRLVERPFEISLKPRTYLGGH